MYKNYIKTFFQLAFNLAIVWLLIFFVLCRGIKSYGRFIVILSIAPIIGLIAVSSTVLSVVNFDSIQVSVSLLKNCSKIYHFLLLGHLSRYGLARFLYKLA